MDQLTDDLQRLSRRGQSLDPDAVIARAVEAASGRSDRERPRARWVSVAAVCVAVLGVGGAAWLLATRQEPAAPATPPVPPTNPAPPPSGSQPAPDTTVADSMSLPAEGLAGLGDLDDDEMVVASQLPDGWSASPVIVSRDWQRWEFSDETGRQAGQSILPGGTGSTDPAAEIRWELDTTNPTSTTATTNAGNLTVLTSGVDLDIVTELLAGIRIGTADDHVAGVFNSTDDGQVVAEGDDGLVIRAAQVSDHLCWSMIGPEHFSDGCTADPFEPLFLGERPQVSDGIGVLNIGGTGIPSNYSDADAPIVRSIVYIAGVATLDIPAVTITLATGETIEVPVSNIDDSFDLGFFVLQRTFDGDAWTAPGPIRSITTPTTATGQSDS